MAETNTKAPVYRYFTADLLTNEILAEVPFRGVSYERAIKGAGRFGGGSPGGHREHPARRALSKALSFHCHRRRLGSAVTEGSPRKGVRGQVT